MNLLLVISVVSSLCLSSSFHSPEAGNATSAFLGVLGSHFISFPQFLLHWAVRSFKKGTWVVECLASGL